MVDNATGKMAEFMALQYLRLKGYDLVACNYVTGRGTGAGEIDIIVKNQDTLVFAEVKKRKDISTAAYAILPHQQERIRRAAEVFLSRHNEYQNFNIRFDAVLVQLPFKIEHIENAF